VGYLNLRKKTLLVISVTLISLIIILYIAAEVILLRSFTSLEQEEVKWHIERSLSALKNEEQVLDELVANWAAWDDTYRFIQDENEEYIVSNINEMNYMTSRINLMVFINSTGQMLLGQKFDFQTKKISPIPVGFEKYIQADSRLLQHNSNETRVLGMIDLPEGPMLVASRPILTSEGNGPAKGVLIMGRYLDDAAVKYLADIVHLPLVAQGYDSIKIDSNFSAAKEILKEEMPIMVQVAKENSVAGFALIRDINNQPCLILGFEMPRTIYLQGQSSIRFFMWYLLIAITVCYVIMMLLLEKLVLSRLAYLNRNVAEIGAGGSLSARVHLPGNDELSSLASAVNEMLTGLEQSHGKLVISEETLRKTNEELEMRVEARTVELAQANKILHKEIIERTQAEERLKYLSLHDPLTGVYNRAVFEDEMNRIEEGCCISVGVIVSDVDGLKLVNDALGNNIGDELLTSAANIMQKTVGHYYRVYRIGGDEFAVLLPGYRKVEVENLCRRLEQSIGIYNSTTQGPPLIITTGMATNEDRDINIGELFKEADNNVSRVKMHHSQSTRSNIIMALMKMLKTRDLVTGDHGDRVPELIAELAMAVHLPERVICDLRLLGKFHDIGKIGIRDSILNKPDRLTEEEVAQMRCHSEIGYRIAVTVPELVPISDWILKHHEWWNGEGYPFGLKGEEIPQECRILSIVDAYDAMTSDRSYRKAMNEKQALAELRRYAGIQFDPQLVEIFVGLIGEKTK